MKRPLKRVFKQRNLWLAGTGIALSGVLILSSHPAPDFFEIMSAQQKVDLSLAPYSDTHISKQAITANAALAAKTFNTIFGEEQETADVINSLETSKPSLPAATPLAADAREYGTWLWTPTLQMTPAYMDTIISGAKENGINVIYLSIDSYLDVYALPDGQSKTIQEKLFADTLETFIQKAHSQNISVDAEAGWRNWAETGNTYKAFAILDYVVNFNATHTEKFRGFQYDIEPYLLDNYQKDQSGVLKRFVDLIDQSANYFGSSDLHFSVVIPDFYDDVVKTTPAFSYNGTNTYTFNHLLTILDTRKNSSLIIMSYRNKAQGDDGTLDISQTEMKEVVGHAARIIIAQETSDVQPSYVTFFDMPKNYYESQLQIVEKTFGSNPNFGGTAVHYANAFLSLK